MIQTVLRTLSVLLLLLVAPTFVLAQAGATGQVNAAVTTPAVTATVAVDAKLTASKTKAAKEIERRITALADINARVQTMQKVTETFKQSLGAGIQAQATALATLKAKIDADTDLETLKTDIQSITQSYRTFALFLPQARIAAMADREVTISNMMAVVGTKLQSRISAAQSAGMDVSALNVTLTDLGTKISDANNQAQAAVTATAVLAPDGGDKAKIDANAAALKTARANLDVAQKDLIAARKDIQIIIDGLKKATVSATATTTVTTTP